MGNSIVANITALNAQGNINIASNKASSSIARLSSGNRIVRASDDVASLATGTALRTQATTLRAALSNAAQGTSLLQVADGSLSQVVDILQRQKAIATQAANGSLTNANRALLNQEFVNLTAEIDRIASSTNFNGVKLINGGLGTASSLANSDALAVAAGATTAAASTGQTAAQGAATVAVKAIEAWNIQTGATLRTAAGAGTMDVTDSSGTVLAGAAYLNVNASVYGQFSSFKLTNVVYGTSATVTATLNGVEFSGNVASGATTVLLQNGNTYMKLGVTALTLTDAGTTAVAQTQLGKDFANTVIERATIVSGVDFAGTRLAGAVGTGTTGNLTARLASSDAVISNFRYVGNSGAANTSVLAVDVNGQTFTATTVRDAVTSAAGKIIFASSDNQFIYLDLAGMTTATTNIRTDVSERTAFVNALNQGISRAGSGLDFSIGTVQSDSIKVSLSSANSVSLFNGASLDVTSAATAQIASNALDTAITKAVSLRAAVGAIQSRFNFASNAIQSSMENQEAARGSLLDTDVSAESTAYASAQVQLQAGIAVLAQANQLPQTLLKLIS